MKLNLLIFSLLGVSVSASGIRGFTPIKGSERRLASSTKTSKKSDKDTTVELSSSGRVIECTGKDCKRFMDLCTDGNFDGQFRGVSGSPSSSSSKSRRLKKTSSSSSDDNVRFFRVGDVEACVIERTSDGDSSSSSSSSDDTTRAAAKSRTTTTTTETTQPPKTKSSGKKGDATRRVLKSSKKSTKDTRIELSSSGRVIECSGKECKKFIDRCTVDEDDVLRVATGSGSSSSKSRRLKPSSSDDGGNVRIFQVSAQDVEDCMLNIELERAVGEATPTEKTSKSKKDDAGRVLHSSWRKWRKHRRSRSGAKTRLVLTSTGDVVRCSGNRCRTFIDRCTDGHDHLNDFGYVRVFGGTTSTSSGKSRRLKKSSSSSSSDRTVRIVRFDVVNADDCDVFGTTRYYYGGPWRTSHGGWRTSHGGWSHGGWRGSWTRFGDSSSKSGK